MEASLQIADAALSAVLVAATSPVIWTAADRTTRRRVEIGGGQRWWIAAVLATVGAFLGCKVGVGGALILMPVVLIGGAAALVDLRERRLPDPLTAALAVATFCAVLAAAVMAPSVAVRAFAGAGIGAVLVLAGRILGPDAVGWGDVKLAPSLAAWLAGTSWSTLYTGLLTWSALIAATTAAGLIRRPACGSVVPYGPAMVLGTIVPIALAG